MSESTQHPPRHALVPQIPLPDELATCAFFADGTRRGELVPLADFTRHRIAAALRNAARALSGCTAHPRHARDDAPTGVELIAAARSRQFESGRTLEKDAGHQRELMAAAECYLAVARSGADGWAHPDGSYAPPGGWPWKESDWDPSEDRTENLAIAGALIAAALDQSVIHTTT